MMILKGRRDMIVDVRSVKVALLGAYMTRADTCNGARFDHCLVHCCVYPSLCWNDAETDDQHTLWPVEVLQLKFG